jgi:hypothetical protein
LNVTSCPPNSIVPSHTTTSEVPATASTVPNFVLVTVIFDPLNQYEYKSITASGSTVTLDPVFFSIAFISEDFAIWKFMSSPKSSKSSARVTFTANTLDVF